MSDRGSDIRPPGDIYTVLLVAAVLVVASGTIFLAVQSQRLFGSWNPFSGA